MALLRIMALGDAGGPKIGPASFCLGVRPTNPNDRRARGDIDAVFDADIVDPANAQGLSCSAAPVDLFLSRFFRPLRPGESVWEIEIDRLPSGLKAVHRASGRDPEHWQIEPAVPMTLAAFQALLASTRSAWVVVQFTTANAARLEDQP